jgi:energy-converting hydrogenase Eha subunit B
MDHLRYSAGLVMIWNTLGRRTALLYLLAVAGCALAGGLLLDSLMCSTDVHAACRVHSTGPGLLGHISAVVLLAIPGYAFLSPKRH